MARVARLKPEGTTTWYHLCARVVGCRGEYPLAEARESRQLIDTIRHFCGIYFCSPGAFCVMGNHYHLVVRLDEPRVVSRKELERRARMMYPSKASQARLAVWSDAQWDHFRERLFDVSELMRNVQAAFARWYNRSHERRGRFWADRFKSTVLGDLGAVLDCMLYIELNPVRAGLVERPEAWKAGSLFLREIGEDGWLLPLEEVCVASSAKEALVEYRERVYYRGSVPTKEGQVAVLPGILDDEIERGFTTSGIFRKRLGYFVEGLMIAGEERIRDQLEHLRASGQYLRRRHPIRHLDGLHLSLREQRSHAVSF